MKRIFLCYTENMMGELGKSYMKKEEDQGMRKEMKKKLGNVFRKAGAGVLLAMFLTVTASQPVSAAAKYVPTADDVQLTKDIVQIATNGNYSAAVMQNGDLYTWGAQTVLTDEGVWSIPTKESEYKDPSIFARNVCKVFLGKYMNGYIDSKDDLYMWGANIDGSLGDAENKDNYAEPVKVLENVKDLLIDNYGQTTAAITNDGELYMWGSNMAGKIGPYIAGELEGTAYTPYKVKLPGKVKSVSVSANGGVTGAVLENGDAYMWGSLESQEQSFFGATDVNQGVPVKVAENVQDLQINRGVRSYLTKDGDLYTWGNNSNRELGRITDGTDEYTPTKIAELSDITSYQLNSTSLALKSDGTLYAWGNNEEGTVGNGTQTAVLTPVKVLDQVQSIVPTEKDDFATVSGAICQDKSLWLWGQNNPLTIGNGNASDIVVKPEKIMDSVMMAVSMTGISFATCEDGSLWGWGWNDRKVIGDFTTAERPYPVLVTLYGPSPAVKDDSTKKKVQKIAVSGISNKIAASRSVSLRADVKPSNASNKKLQWKSSNTKYATVSQSGKVTTKKAGAGKKVTITANATDGSKIKGSYTIQIKKHAVSKISLKAKSTSVKAGKSVQIKATVKTTGKDANKTLKWSSSNTKYATVNSKGKVVAKKAGKGKKVKITAQALDGTGKKASVTIKIK